MKDVARRVRRMMQIAVDLSLLVLRRDLRPVRNESDADMSIRELALGWIRSTIAQPDSRLGRAGAVCPCTPPMLDQEALTAAVYSSSVQLSADVIRRVVLKEGLRHHRAIDRSSAHWDLCTHLVIFAGGRPEHSPWFEQAWEQCLEALNERGIMLAVAYPGCRRPAWSSADVFPFDAPASLFVIRPMTLRDILFIGNRGGVLRYRGLFGARFRTGSISSESHLARVYQEKLNQHCLPSV